jgi:Fe-S-cluster containining protein
VSVFDCLRCGACCTNPAENAAEGYVDYVEVRDGEPLLRRPDLLKKYVITNTEGERHLRLDAHGRCLALLGGLGKSVRCAIYAQRARGCRRVQAGDAECIQVRADRGIRS